MNATLNAAGSSSAAAHPDDFLLKTPSDRDQRIYFEVAICSRSQTAVAEQFGLSQGQVSQIVAEVAAWRADATPMSAGTLSGSRRQRLARSDARERLERLLEKTQQELTASGEPDVVRREGAWDGKEWHSTTTGRPRTAVQLLKLARNLTLDLAKLDAEPAPPAELETERFHAEMHGLLCRCIDDAQKQGKLPAELAPTIVNEVFRQLIPNQLNYGPRSAPGQLLDATVHGWDRYHESVAAICAAAVASGCAGLESTGAEETKPANTANSQQVVISEPPGAAELDEPVRSVAAATTCDRSLEAEQAPGDHETNLLIINSEPEPETEADALWRKIRDYHLRSKPRQMKPRTAPAATDAAPPVRRRRRGLEFRRPRLQDGAERLSTDG